MEEYFYCQLTCIAALPFARVVGAAAAAAAAGTAGSRVSNFCVALSHTHLSLIENSDMGMSSSF